MNTFKADFFPKQELEDNIPKSIICSSFLEIDRTSSCLSYCGLRIMAHLLMVSSKNL